MSHSKFIKVVAGVPQNYSLSQLKADHPNAMFPADFPDEVLSTFDVYRVTLTATSGIPDGYELVDGQWQTKWRDPTPQEAAAALSAKRSGMRVTMRQARLALHSAGLLSSVDAAIAALDEPARTAAQIEWEYGSVVERTSPLIAILGQTEEQIDALFEAAMLL